MLTEHLLESPKLARSPSRVATPVIAAAPPSPPSPTCLARFFEGSSVRDFFGPLIGPPMVLPSSVAFVGVIVAACPELVPDFPRILSTVFFSNAFGTLVYAGFSQFRTSTGCGLLSAMGFAQMIGVIRTTVPDADLFVHLVVCQGLFTFLLGVLLVLLAWVDGMWYLRFLPYTVSSGFTMGMGFLILDGGFLLSTGLGVRPLVFSLGSVSSLTLAHAGAMLLSASVLFALNRCRRFTLRVPFGIAVVTAATHGTAWMLGLDQEALLAYGFLLDGLTADSWTVSWEELFTRLTDVRLGVILQTPMVSLMASYLVMHILCYPFYAVAVAEIDKSAVGKPISIKKELGMVGACMALIGALGGVPEGHSTSLLVVMQDSGALSKLWSLLVGITYCIIYFSDLRVWFSSIPKCAFGGLVASMGFGFIQSSWAQARERIAPAELRLVVLTAIVTWYDLLSGLAFGLFLVVVFFIVEYAGMTGINRRATLATVRSNVERTTEASRVLDAHGDNALVFWLTGYIFFGSAVGAVEDIEIAIKRQPHISHLIIDFENVPAVDASGVHHFTNFAAACLDRKPPILVCFSGTVRRLKLALLNAAKSKDVHGLRMEGDLIEEALSWAEDGLLQRSGSIVKKRPNIKPPAGLCDTSSASEVLTIFLQHLARDQAPAILQELSQRLSPAVHLKHFPQDTEIFVQGEFADCLLFVVEGSVALMRNIGSDEGVKLPEHHLNKKKGDVFVFEERKRVRVQQVGAGAILGSAEFCAANVSALWTASAVAVEPSQLLLVPFKEMRSIIGGQPEFGLLATQQLGKRASAHLLRLLRKSDASPFTTL